VASRCNTQYDEPAEFHVEAKVPQDFNKVVTANAGLATMNEVTQLGIVLMDEL